MFLVSEKFIFRFFEQQGLFWAVCIKTTEKIFFYKYNFVYTGIDCVNCVIFSRTSMGRSGIIFGFRT